MGMTHLLLISVLTPHHIPILPPFSSRPHLPIQAGFRSASDIFDVERWARSINKELVEWKDVKDLSGSAGHKAPDGSIQADGRDQLGCWSVWATSDLNEKKPRGAYYFVDHLNLGMPPILSVLPLIRSIDASTFVLLVRCLIHTYSAQGPTSSRKRRGHPHNF